jgi:peptidoglycan hydrolase CwlO-like protein
MHERELNCATIGVANNRDMSGMATANEVNRSLRTRKGRSLGRITFSTLLGPLMAAGLFVALAPMPVRADSAETTALQAQVTSLQATVSALQGQVNTQQGQINTLQKQLTMAKSVLALAPYVAVTLDSFDGKTQG